MKKSSALSTVVASAHPLQTVNDWSLMPPTEGDAEPRVRDVDLGDRLGYAEPRMVRKLIKRLRDSGEIPGVQSRDTVERQRTRNGGEREYAVEEFWLTEREALLVCSASDAPNAGVVRAALVDLFIAWRRGKLQPSAALVLDHQGVQAIVEMGAGIRAILGALNDQGGRIKDIEGDVGGLKSDIDGIKKTLAESQPRRDVKTRDRRAHVDHARARGGRCPHCSDPVFSIDGKFIGEIDHWFGRSLAGLHQTWPLCAECNSHPWGSAERSQMGASFESYQQWIRRRQGRLFS